MPHPLPHPLPHSMPMQGSKPSKASKDLGNVIAQLKSGKTRGSSPRDLYPEEIGALEQKRDALKAVMKQGAKERAVGRINGHTTTQADRVICAVTAEVAASAEGIKQHVTAEMQKLQFRPAAASGSTTFHVDHAAIRTNLERGGFTAAQLLSLHKAANLNPPVRVNAAGSAVPEKAKYQLAQSLCSAAGSGQHSIQSSASRGAERLGDAGSSARSERQLLDYATLGAWMEALRHQRPIAEWEPPVHAALLEPPPPKRRRKAEAEQPAAVEAATASGSAAETARRDGLLSANADSPKPPAPAPRKLGNGGASSLELTDPQSTTCSATSGATSPTTSATASPTAGPTASPPASRPAGTTTESHHMTSADHAPANNAALLRASSTAEAPRPPKASVIDARLRHTDAVEVFRSTGKGAEEFSHWAPLTMWGLCGHTCSNNKLCNNNAGDCGAHSRREKDLMECEDSRSTIVERGVCGVPEAGGGPCQKPQGQCSIHGAGWHQKRELCAMREEDDVSCIADRGRCGVLPRRGGDACGHPRTRCPHHASEQGRCHSMVDADPTARCLKYRAGGSRFCNKHADFPDFSVVAQRWVREHQRTGLPLEEEELFMAHVRAVYPDASYQLPKIHDFQKFVAAFA